MELVVIVERSDGLNPGHMVVGQEDDGKSRFFGFAFKAKSLPIEQRDLSKWQEYLYANKIPGEIQEESSYVRLIRSQKSALLYEKRTECNLSIETQIPLQKDWKQSGSYSFRPDDFHRDGDPCYNCVTWATMIANNLVPGFLNPVSQGRIKLIVRQLAIVDQKEGQK